MAVEAGVFGIDISRYQPNFNFNKAKKEGVKFVIIKAGGGDGSLYKDSQFESHYKNATEKGFKVGAYYFGAAKSIERAEQEANKFLSYLHGKNFEMGVYYDVEAGMLKLDRELLTQIIIKFCEIVKRVYPNVGIYSSLSVFNNRVFDNRLSGYLHWIAYWSTSKPVLKSGNKTDMWQFGGEVNNIRTNKVAGVTCDQDYCYMNIDIPANKPLKSTEEIVKEVLDGKWGNGTERKQRLTAAGYNYSVIQSAVNKAVAERDKRDDVIEKLAKEVIQGLWGNGAARKQAITAAGYDYGKVQARVNELMKKK